MDKTKWKSIVQVRFLEILQKNLMTAATMKKKNPKKNSIDGTNLPDSRLVELLDRCIISVKDIKFKIKKNKHDGK